MLCLPKKCSNIRTLWMWTRIWTLMLVLLIVLVSSLSIGWKTNLRTHFTTFVEKGNNSTINKIPDACARFCNSIQQKPVDNTSAQMVSNAFSRGWDKCICGWKTSLANNSTSVQKETNCPLVRPRLSDKPLPITGLISFPGAGNTWTRHLLQQVSGIGTSNIYQCDRHRIYKNFPFECLGVTNKTLAVKVHTFQQKYKNVFQRVILIIRNPYKNIVSFFNYFYGGKNHVGYAQAAHYKDWPKFVHENIKGWQDVNSDVLRRYTGPLYVLTYENLQKDLKGELGRVFKFLNMTVNATVLDCAVVNQEGDDHRAKKSVQFKELFTAEMIRNITIATDKVSDVLESRFGRRLNYSMPEN